MSSRISRYQESMSKFLRNKSCINDIGDSNIKQNILNTITDFDYTNNILLLAVLKAQSSKNNLSMHGYYVASNCALLSLIVKLMDNRGGKLSGSDKDNLIREIMIRVNLALGQNIESAELHYTDKSRILGIYNKCSKLLNNKLSVLISDMAKPEIIGNITRTDVITCKFSDREKIGKALVKIPRISSSAMEKFIKEKYALVSYIAMGTGWLIGGGDEKNLKTLEAMSINFGTMVKIAYDFTNLESDIMSSAETQSYSKNYLINYGFQNCFELFMENKQKFIDGCIKLSIYTNTMKEIIDYVEIQIDRIIDESSPDLKSAHTLDSDT